MANVKLNELLFSLNQMGSGQLKPLSPARKQIIVNQNDNQSNYSSMTPWTDKSYSPCKIYIHFNLVRNTL